MDVLEAVSYLFVLATGAILGRILKVFIIENINNVSKFYNKYPVVEGLNIMIYILCFLKCGWNINFLLNCIMCSILIVISIIDSISYKIPNILNTLLLINGVIITLLNLNQWQEHVFGLFFISGILLMVYIITAGKGIGGGDIKLMAAAGLILGGKLCLAAFMIGSITGCILHGIRIRFRGGNHVFALGPYLSIGIIVTILFGEDILNMYMHVIKNT